MIFCAGIIPASFLSRNDPSFSSLALLSTTDDFSSINAAASNFQYEILYRQKKTKFKIIVPVYAILNMSIITKLANINIFDNSFISK